MRWLTIIIFAIVFGVIFLMGMVVGYYYALSHNTRLLALGAFGFAFLTWVGSGADLLGLLREWYKDRREQETIPSLVFDGFWKNKNESGWKNEERYFIKVSRKGGEGEAEGVTGHVEIKNKLSLKQGVWLDTPSLYVSIITHKYLFLFQTVEYKGKTIITFHGVDYDPNKPEIASVRVKIMAIFFFIYLLKNCGRSALHEIPCAALEQK